MDKGKLLADAAALLKCDGPHLRAWARERSDEFVATIHEVAEAAMVVATASDSMPVAAHQPLKPIPPAPPPQAEVSSRGTPRQQALKAGLGGSTKHLREES